MKTMNAILDCNSFVQQYPKDYAVRLADFVIAKNASSTSKKELIEKAGNVIVRLGRSFSTVAELVDKAQKHGWNSTIYEAWCYEFRNRILAYRSQITKIEFAALRTHAFGTSDGDMEVSSREAHEAVHEASLALYGS